jgi:hypothetical protein
VHYVKMFMKINNRSFQYDGYNVIDIWEGERLRASILCNGFIEMNRRDFISKCEELNMEF